MTEQQMADAMLEMASQTVMAAWHMAYASDRGLLRVELDKARTQLKELTEVHASCDQKHKRSEQLLSEAEVLLTSARAAGLAMKKERDQVSRELEQAKKMVAALTKEKDDLRAESVEDKEIQEEMKEAIVVESRAVIFSPRSYFTIKSLTSCLQSVVGVGTSVAKVSTTG
ncbi:hypothetical protein LR48_Vigan09g117600 [Vigna angularis]|uniref:Uncharacterized protein n=1 Tax=Phaseolus angularis TaxID=3914 RepID=A0A0L9VC83_PHAAN|nr:hypothetical protein LR48_Vigan09g117600 [Vigna angularis]